MFCEDAAQRFGGVLLRPESRSASHRAVVRFARPCTRFFRSSSPSSPLIAIQILKPACIAALKRIFKLCDANKDGILDAMELNDFQVPIPSNDIIQARVSYVRTAQVLQQPAPAHRVGRNPVNRAVT